MKKIIIFLVTITLTFSSANIINAQVVEPTIFAEGAVLMDFKTGRVLYDKNADKPLAMASTTKIMTLILALENGNLEDTVIVSKNASRAPDVQLDLVEGEEVLLGDILYPLMLESSKSSVIIGLSYKP